MPEWEYLSVRAAWSGTTLKPEFLDDQELPNWSAGISMRQYANQLRGKAGNWSAQPPFENRSAPKKRHRYSFRRQKP